MNFDTALQRILTHLKQHYKATNTVLTELVGGDSDLFNKVKEQLIIDDLDQHSGRVAYGTMQGEFKVIES